MFKVNIKNAGVVVCRHLSFVVVSGVFIVNFENISHLFLVFLLLTLNK